MAKKIEQPQPQPTEALVPQQPAELALPTASFLEDAEQFSNDFSRNDIAIPFLQVLQSGSPQTQEGNPAAIDGAKAGYFFNTVTKQAWPGVKDGLVLVPVQYEKTFIEWRLREKGGGYVKNHGLQAGMKLMAQCQKDDKGRMVVPGSNGDNQLVETAQYLVLAIIPETGEAKPMMFCLTSTQLKTSRLWNSAVDDLRVQVGAKKIRPPMFYMTYTARTVYDSNEKGNWYGVVITPGQPTIELPGGEALYLQARELRKANEAGQVQVVQDDADASGAAASDDGTPF